MRGFFQLETLFFIIISSLIREQMVLYSQIQFPVLFLFHVAILPFSFVKALVDLTVFSMFSDKIKGGRKVK